MVVTLPVINVGTAVDGSSPKTKAQWSGKIVNKQLMKCKQCVKTRNLLTVWNFQDFCITEILREINFVNSRSAKSVILTQLGALNFDFYEFLHFLRLKYTKLTKVPSPEMAK